MFGSFHDGSQKRVIEFVYRLAGRYLCEETLYTLEYLKSKNKLETVLFCHVPPLGTRVGEKSVTAEYIEQFVKDMLEAWCIVDRKTKPLASVGEPHG